MSEFSSLSLPNSLYKSKSSDSLSTEDSINKIAKEIADRIPEDVAKKLLKNNSKNTFEEKINTYMKSSDPTNTSHTGHTNKSIENYQNISENKIHTSIYNLSIINLLSFILKSFIDISKDIDKLSYKHISFNDVSKLLLKDNRILYIGFGLLLLSIIIFILLNFLNYH
jgi:hypothetical protein